MAPAAVSFALSVLAICSTLLVLSEARPRRRPYDDGPPTITLTDFAVPTNNGTTSLTTPMPGVSVKAITIGRGTQNYTCADSTSSSIPVSIGALATLFDATPLIPFLPAPEATEILDLLPSYLVSFPLALLSPLPVKGHHYFNAQLTPTFDLTVSGTGFLLGNKTGDIAAPTGSTIGPMGQGFGAVDWLQLTAKNGSSGLMEAYRVFTAGGKAPATCEGQASTFEMQYSAEYWFYG